MCSFFCVVLKKFYYPTVRLGVKERVDQFLSFPAKCRDRWVILSKDNLRQSSLWGNVFRILEGTVPLSILLPSQVVFIARSLEKVNERPLLPKLTLEERAFTYQVMSQNYQSVPKGAGVALECM